MNKGCVVALTVCAAAVCAGGLLIMFYVFPRFQKYNNSAKAANIEVALRTFQREFGQFPEGEHAEVMRALQGKNERNRPYLSQEMRRFFNERGEFVDEWGTPFRIEVSGETVEVLSAGPNAVFGDADDIDSSLAFEVGASTHAGNGPGAGKNP